VSNKGGEALGPKQRSGQKSKRNPLNANHLQDFPSIPFQAIESHLIVGNQSGGVDEVHQHVEDSRDLHKPTRWHVTAELDKVRNRVLVVGRLLSKGLQHSQHHRVEAHHGWRRDQFCGLDAKGFLQSEPAVNVNHLVLLDGVTSKAGEENEEVL